MKKMNAATEALVAGGSLLLLGVAIGFFVAQRRLVRQHEVVLAKVLSLAEQRKALLQQGGEVRLALGLDQAEEHGVVLDAVRMMRDGLTLDLQGEQ